MMLALSPHGNGGFAYLPNARSERGAGRADQPGNPPASLPEPWPQVPSGLRILVADDNESSRVAVERLLRSDGHEIVVAGDGFDAAKAVFSRDFDLVLMDVEMPNLSGIEATRLIRALGGPYEALPIVALTAHTLLEELAQCRQAGMNGHVAKPVDGASLRQIVANWAKDNGRAMHTDYAPATSDTVIDTGELLELFEGDRLAVAGLLEAARSAIDGDVARIEGTAHANDVAGVRVAAHRLVGTSCSIAATRLTAVSRLVESAARSGSVAVVVTHLDELRAALGATTTAIERFVRGAAGNAGASS